MNLIDQSLDDIIELQKLERKQKQARNAARKPNALTRVSNNGRLATSHLLYARPPRETALFTETYKALSAPVKEIYTSRYIPQTGPIKLYTINHQAKGPGLLSTKPIRLVTTQQTKRGNGTSSYNKSRTDTRSVYRAGDYYRPSPRAPSSRNKSPIRCASELRSEKVSVSNETASDASSRSIILDNHNRNNSENPVCPKEEPRSPRLSPKVQSDQIIVPPKEEPSKSPDAMDTDDVIVIKGMAPLGADLAIKGESGPATIEIHNLDPGTSAEDVKVVCSRFGEIRSCICSNGVAQVTYVRKPAGVAAVENLDGKKADNDQILKVIMLRHPVFHTIPNISHQPTFVPGPLNLLVRAVQGTISNPGTAYSIQVQAARRILELQQNRVNQLRDKAQSVEALQMQEQSIETQREELMREYM